MALTKCKECGHEISDQAQSCPNCGAPQQKPKAKGIGCGGAIVIVVLVGWIASQFSTPDVDRSSTSSSTPAPAARTAEQITAEKQQEEAAAIAKCKTQIDGRKVEHAKLMAMNKFWEAARAIGDCYNLLDDPVLKDMVATAEQRHYTETANDPKKSPAERVTAIERLLRDYPEKAKGYEKLRVQLQVKAEQSERATRKRAAAAEAARRRKEGVSIGMSKEEVLQSSWGRPRTTNTSTYSFGTHEQWVYDGGYL